MLYYFNRLLTFIIIFGGMDMEPQKKLLMIVNPRAGRSKPRGPLYDAAAALCDAGYLLRICRTTAAGDAARIAAQEGGVPMILPPVWRFPQIPFRRRRPSSEDSAVNLTSAASVSVFSYM